MSELPAELRTKLAHFASGKPERQALIERLTRKHAQAATPDERASIERLLWSLLRPSRVNWYLLIGVPILLGAAFVGIFVVERRHDAAVAAGQRTTAQVLRMDEGSCIVGDKNSDCLRLSLRVYPAGAASYDAVLEENIKHRFLPRVQPGSWLTVSVNQQDPSQVMFDESVMAIPSPAPVGS
jgi:hypothetical protein